MANLEFYKSVLGVTSTDELEQLFCSTLVESNFTYSFFVNWEKVKSNRDAFRNELSLLSGLSGDPNPKRHLRDLISRYPEVVKVLPLLIAERTKSLKIVETLTPNRKYAVYNFDRAKYSDAEAAGIVEFCEKTGLLGVLTSLKSPLDYSTGVEVGMDTNARKNRSGSFMEELVMQILSGIVTNNRSIVRISQKQFKALKKEYSVAVPDGLQERKFDEVLMRDGLGINIEVNFYSGTGSKPSEIVDSYIERKSELQDIGWKFVWITDGAGWRRMRNQLRKGLVSLDYVLNLHMLAKGMLERIVSNV